MDANVQMFIEHLKNHDVYPGYPPLSERWGVRKSTYRKWMRDGMPANTIAPGLYNHPCYLEGVAKGRAILDDGSKKFWDREFAPSFTGKYDHDANGRPLHPYTQQLLEAGLALEGPGFYWNYGPNLCADPVVIGASNDGRLKVILITRRDTAQLALPGGHIDPDEAPLDAALRELQEETTLDLLELPRGAMKSVELLYEGPVWDSRMTINAWPETTSLAFVLEDGYIDACQVSGRDDAAEARCMPVDEETLALLGPCHRSYVQRAVRVYERLTGTSVWSGGKIGR